MKSGVFRKGKSYLCVDSQSSSYLQGKTYDCFLGVSKKPCLRGEDGLEDTGSKLVSKFKEVEPQENTRPILKLVFKGDEC